ncbi:hypothetical protein JCM9279_005547 [Rhodotorula babjevae]
MSSMRKAVDGATKPKRAAPKAKYIDPLVQATFQQDGQLQEVVRTLASRMRDPNTTVVFKSLIVLHTLMRSGSIDSVFPYLASSSVSLSLSSAEAANVAAYGQYLAVRIKAFGTLKRDAIRDKSDRRNASRMRKLSVEQGLLRETREVQRMIAALVEAKFYADDVDDDVSMTALRLLVKDLLVLFTVVNEGVINLLENFFALSKPDCDLALKIYKTFCRDTEKVVAYLGTAKKLYSVLNIPIPNLKHAPLSLANSLDEYVRDPNFEQNRQEYKEVKRIADGGAPRSTPPRSSSPARPSSSSAAAPAPSSTVTTTAPAPSSAAPPKSFTDFFDSIETAQTPMFAASPVLPQQQATMAMFAQPTGFGFNPFVAAPQPTGMGMPMMGSPFGQAGVGMMQPQMTGFNPFLQAQPTGYAQPMPMQQHMTGFGGAGGPFGGAQGGGQGLAPQMTGQANPFRQSMMMTGAGPGGGGNPFGMGMQPLAPPVGQGQGQNMMPQATGNPFGAHQQQQQQRSMSMMPQATGNPFGQQQQLAPSSSSTGGLSVSTAPGAPPLGAPTSPFHASSPHPPPHPLSTNAPSPASPAPAPLVAQKTGARNPFAPAPGTVIPQTVPVQPKQPSMYELAHLRQQQTGFQGQQPEAQVNGAGSPFGQAPPQQQQQQQQQSTAPPPKQDAFSAFLAQQQARRDAEAAGGAQPGGATPLIAQKTGGLFATIASDLAASRGDAGQAQAQGGASSPFRSGLASSSTFAGSSGLNGAGPTSSSSLSTPFSSLSISTSNPNPTSALSPSLTGANSYTASPLSAQPTAGFSSVRAFQPTSTFGSTLASEISASVLSSQYTGLGAGARSGDAGASGASGGQAQAQQPPFSSQPSQQQQQQPTGMGGGYGSGGFGGAGGSGGVASLI